MDLKGLARISSRVLDGARRVAIQERLFGKPTQESLFSESIQPTQKSIQRKHLHLRTERIEKLFILIFNRKGAANWS